jgi:uncharacterized protein YqeY
MAMIERISEDLKAAMKSGDKLRLETLRMVRAALIEKQVEKRPSGGITPDDEVAVLVSASKKRKEAIESFRAGGRTDLAEQEERELTILQEYLPEQVSSSEIEEVVKRTIAETNASGLKDFGKVMPVVMKELKGRADGKLVQETVRKILGET